MLIIVNQVIEIPSNFAIKTSFLMFKMTFLFILKAFVSQFQSSSPNQLTRYENTLTLSF